MSNIKFSKRVNHGEVSIIREILRLTVDPNVISFAGGLPSPAGFPVQKIKEAYDKVLSENPYMALQYNSADGYIKLREWVVDYMASKGAQIKPSNVLIVSGSQQALDLVSKVFLDEGSKILVEAPSYLGALQCFDQYFPKYETIETDDHGLIPESITESNAKDARFLYALPNFHNPTGRTLSVERRIALLEKCKSLNVPIIEDDPYGELIYHGESLPGLYALSQKHGGTVIRLGSFSKVLSPGMRIGYIVADEKIINALVELKQATDLHTSVITQMAVYETIKDNFLDEHLPKVREIYRNQCNYMLESLEENFKDIDAKWTKPDGGMFIWMTLPPEFNTLDLLTPTIRDYKVAYVPGSAFYVASVPVYVKHNELRLSFVTVAEDKIRKGVEQLAQSIKNAKR